MSGESTEVTPVDLVALIVEMVAFGLLGWAGWRLGTSTPVRAALMILIVLVAAPLWGLFASPKAKYATLPRSIATKVVVLGGSIIAAAELLPVISAALYAVVTVVDTALLYVGPFARKTSGSA